MKEEFSVQPGYVLVERPDNHEIVSSELPRFLESVADYCAEAGSAKVLIVGPSTNVKLDTIALFKLGEAIAQLGLHIALVESHDASAQQVEFLENVSRNRGAPLQFFETIAEAKQWLGVD